MAWPSNSCTARKSWLDSSKCDANEWRNICGCTRISRPWRLAQYLTLACTERLLRRLEMALLMLILLLIGVRWRALFVALVAFAAAQGLGQWLAGQG